MLDTNVLVAALRSKSGASARIINAVYSGHVTALASVALFTVYEAVLTRPEHLEAGKVSRDEVLSALDELAGKVGPVEAHYSWRPQLRVPDDEMVLEAAVNGAAHAIVSFETTTFRTAAARFSIEVLTPGECWARVSS